MTNYYCETKKFFYQKRREIVKQLIEKFEIFGLFGYQNVTLKFEQTNTVFLGNNGVGKTTILSMLYFILKGDLEALTKIEFESFIIKLYDSETQTSSEEFHINSIEIQTFLERPKSNTRFNRDMDVLRQSNNKVEELVVEQIKLYETDNILVKQDIIMECHSIFNKGHRVPYGLFHNMFKHYIRDYCNNTFNTDQVEKLVNYISTEITGKHQILYFPTYRRIEEDLSVLQIEKENFDDTQQDFFGSKREDSPRGELIQFGMQDVQILINNLLGTIKETAISEFNKMTGELLYQYASEDIDTDSDFYEDDIRISLSRVGSQISEGLTNKILQMYSEKKLYENKYLLNLIINLIEKNKKLEPIDAKIKKFVNVCNSYLYRKSFVYDPSSVNLKLIHDYKKNDTLELSSLSSGEKQIVSTFAKLYLTDVSSYIVLFDEPELSLSIEWQEKLLPNIFESEKCKFSISITHSPNIIKRVFENTKDIEEYITKNE